MPNGVGRSFDDLCLHVALGCVAIDENSELPAVFGEEAACELWVLAIAFDAIALEMNSLYGEREYLGANLNLDITKEACVLS
jgi:hypothetical protein